MTSSPRPRTAARPVVRAAALSAAALTLAMTSTAGLGLGAAHAAPVSDARSPLGITQTTPAPEPVAQAAPVVTLATLPRQTTGTTGSGTGSGAGVLELLLTAAPSGPERADVYATVTVPAGYELLGAVPVAANASGAWVPVPVPTPAATGWTGAAVTAAPGEHAVWTRVAVPGSLDVAADRAVTPVTAGLTVSPASPAPDGTRAVQLALGAADTATPAHALLTLRPTTATATLGDCPVVSATVRTLTAAADAAEAGLSPAGTATTDGCLTVVTDAPPLVAPGTDATVRSTVTNTGTVPVTVTVHARWDGAVAVAQDGTPGPLPTPDASWAPVTVPAGASVTVASAARADTSGTPLTVHTTVTTQPATEAADGTGAATDAATDAVTDAVTDGATDTAARERVSTGTVRIENATRPVVTAQLAVAAPVTAGSPASYALTVTNTGTAATADASAVVTVPDGFAPGPDATTVTGPLEPGASRTATFTATADADLPAGQYPSTVALTWADADTTRAVTYPGAAPVTVTARTTAPAATPTTPTAPEGVVTAAVRTVAALAPRTTTPTPPTVPTGPATPKPSATAPAGAGAAKTVARDDMAATLPATAVRVDVLANDDGASLSARLVTAAQHGSVVCAADCRYTPTAGFTGLDTFTYAAKGPGGAATAVVTVEVGKVGHATPGATAPATPALSVPKPSAPASAVPPSAPGGTPGRNGLPDTGGDRGMLAVAGGGILAALAAAGLLWPRRPRRTGRHRQP